MITSVGAQSSIKAMVQVIDVDVLLVASEKAIGGEDLKMFFNDLSMEVRQRLQNGILILFYQSGYDTKEYPRYIKKYGVVGGLRN